MKILNFPRARQAYRYDCGPTALQVVLAYYGVEVRTEKLICDAHTKKKTGTTIKNMVRVLKKHGCSPISEKMRISDLIGYIDSDVPVLVLLQAREDYHRVVAIGYDDEHIIFEDPYTFHRVFLSFSDLEKRRYVKEHGKKVIRHGIAVQGKTITYDENYLQPMM